MWHYIVPVWSYAEEPSSETLLGEVCPHINKASKETPGPFRRCSMDLQILGQNSRRRS